MRHNIKHRIIASKIGVEDYKRHIIDLYTINKLSGQEIADYIKQKTGEDITARSIQRVVNKYSNTREKKEAFNLAISKGRVQWKYKEFKYKRPRISQKLRYTALQRDKFHCILCGRGADNGVLLEVDHITPLCKGGKTIIDNLQTLCHECNKGKQIVEKER